MKYQFGRNSKKLSSEQIKGHMNFETVATGAKAFVGAKLISSVLKSNAFTPIAATVGTVATVATLLVGPTLLEKEQTPTPEPARLEVVEPVEMKDSLTSVPLVVEKEEEVVEEERQPVKQSASIDKVKPSNEVKEEPHIAPQPNEPIENRDVFIRARPLPDLESFKAFISSELNYPEEARKDSTEGFVRVYFSVNERGIAEHFKINKSLGDLFDNEAVRVLKMYQNWEPASFNGQAVESLFQINIQFEFEKPYPGDTIKYY